MTMLFTRRLGQILSQQRRRSWRSAGMERPYLWMRFSPQGHAHSTATTNSPVAANGA